MVKGVAAKFKSYSETIPRFLSIIKFDQEVKKHPVIVLKPSLKKTSSHNTSAAFVEEVLKFCLAHKDSNAKIFIAEGSDGEDTLDVFGSAGYKQLSEKYSVGLIDLNNTEVEEVLNGEFLKFDKIYYPKMLLESYLVVLPRLAEDDESEMQGSLSTMLGAFPSSHYKGIFSSSKSKIRKWPIKYSIHDIVRCKMPNVAIIDASDYGSILVGKPLEIDKQASKLLGREWKSVSHLRLLDESFTNTQKALEVKEAAKALKQKAE